MNGYVQWMCPRCKVVYNVLYEGENIWHVDNPDFRLVVAGDGSVGPENIMSANQTQFSVAGPLCLLVDCVISKTRGLLSDEPIPVDLG